MTAGGSTIAYSAPITVSSSETVKAIAVAFGYATECLGAST
jgi:hypothetical protein